MKKIKYIISVFFIVLIVQQAQTQSGLIIESSQQYSSFNFTATNGSISRDYNGILTGAYNIGYTYTADIGLLTTFKAGMRNAGASMIYDNMNYTWNLKYMQAQVGAGYIYRTKIVSPYITISGYYAHLLEGNQLLNNEYFNIKESGSISGTDYGIIGELGIRLVITNEISIKAAANYLYGLANIESNSEQKAGNYANGGTFGLVFNF